MFEIVPHTNYGIKLIGLSTDSKNHANVVPGSEFYETDTGMTYVYNDIGIIQG